MKKILNNQSRKNRKGFTLLEILVVIGIIGILAAIVIVAINPGRQFSQARNAQRWNDVNAILNATHQYAVDNVGSLPTGIDGNYRVLGTSGSGCDTTCGSLGTQAACLNLATALVDTYIVGIPTDPSSGDAANTDYYISTTGSGRVEVGSCDPDLSAVISITR